MLEITLFIVAVVAVVGLGIWKSRDEAHAGEAGAAGYFLAGRGLTWWLVGFSLIAANISTEQFVGMSGKSADWVGMAIAGYEWFAAITLVGVAFVFLPRFLKCGLYTIPEFLEYRYGAFSRTIMAIATMVILVGVPTASVIFSGAKVVSGYYPDVPVLGNLTAACWFIAVLAAVYVFIGGLKACAWTDLIWGAALIVGGAVVMVLAFGALAERPAEELIQTKVANSTATVADLEAAGGWERFMLLNDGKDGEAVALTGPNGAGGKVHMVRPKDDPEIPWTALVLGLWIPNFFYWGLNQYIVQRTLGSKSLAEGQKGIVFAAFLKLLIPFVVVIPGILAFNLFSGELRKDGIAKNQKALAQLVAGERVGFHVTDSFAELEGAQVGTVIAHNARLAGVAVPAIPAEAGPADIGRIANNLCDEAVKLDKKLPTQKLVGYDYDSAFPVLLRMLIKDKPWLSWFVLAAIFGAVVSSLASMLNSASTIATMDIVNKIKPDLSQAGLVGVGRACTVIFVIIAALIAPSLGSPKFGGIFTFIQEFQGFISPGVLAVFLVGFLVPKAPRFLGWSGIMLNAVLYGSFKWFLGAWLVQAGLWFAPEVSFLDRMGLCFLIVLAYCAAMTLWKPLAEPAILPERGDIPLESSQVAKVAGIGVIILTIALYVVFW
jgi:solute:Na+ symporter, SSS family